MRHGPLRSDNRVGSTFAAAALFGPVLFGREREQLCVALLDADLRPLTMMTVAGGQRSIVVSPRALMREALRVEARAVVIAHNHPGGSLEPSAADRTATRRLADVARSLDIRLLDHLVFADGEVVSFRELGLL